jgi:polyisoprenoid-binding protein YceI
MAVPGKRWLWILVTAAIVAFGGAYGAFVLVGGSANAAPPAALSSTSPSASSAPAPGGLNATWTVQSTDSFVGYRVREQFTFLPAPTDAVGRTSAITGQLTVDGLKVSAVDVKADLRRLKSDKSMRDERLHTMGIESDTFPTAEFTLTDPIVFPARPAAGETVKNSAKGTLTLHGVTRNVTIALQARWSGDSIEVVGSLPIQFADYDITLPSIGPITVEDHGTMEFHLSFAKQS